MTAHLTRLIRYGDWLRLSPVGQATFRLPPEVQSLGVERAPSYASGYGVNVRARSGSMMKMDAGWFEGFAR